MNCKKDRSLPITILYAPIRKYTQLHEEQIKTADKFQENPSAHLVDMEAYSIAKVCKIFGFDFAAYKFVSDDGNADEWKQNHMNGADLFKEVIYGS